MTSRPTSGPTLSSERGAILVHVAVASIAIIAFSMFVIDYGVLWVSRNQAQNAADAGALAGAVALGYDDFANRNNDGPAKVSAQQVALANSVFGEAPDVQVETDVLFYDEDPTKFPDECADDTCIRVDVYRTNRNGRTNPLPMMFGQLVGLVEQGVRATATARAAFASATDCLKPWAVMDKWEERWEDGAAAVDPYSDDSAFDKYDGPPDAGELDPDVLVPDYYEPPSTVYDPDTGEVISHDYGTGFHPYDSNHDFTDDYGRQFVLRTGNTGSFEWGSGWFMALNIGTCGPGVDCYRENVMGCVNTPYAIGDTVPVQTGNFATPSAHAVEGGGPIADEDSLIGQDPDAYWDITLNDGRGGVAGSAFGDASPRIVAVPLINPDSLALVINGSSEDVIIGNIAGFFVEDVGPGPDYPIIGRLMTLPGKLGSGSGGSPSSFLVNISLIR